MSPRRAPALSLLCLALFAGCGSSANVVDGGSGVCTEDTNCDNHVFCDGVEICGPAGADGLRRCAAGSVPCGHEQRCSESFGVCVPRDCVESAADADGDGARSLVCGGDDCDDLLAGVHPGAAEVCDGVDNNCDGQTDEGFPRYFRDADGDGYGSDNGPFACAPADGYTLQGGDCDDAIATTYPGAHELCDGVDNNCDGVTDESVSGVLVYRDADGDGYGAGSAVRRCPGVPGYSANAGDCDDANVALHPGATELCNGRDDDCDGATDPPATSATCGPESTCTAGACEHARSLSVASNHVCVLHAGAVSCLGNALSEHTSPPDWTVAGTAGAVEVASGDTFACARTPDRTVRCWGVPLPTWLGDPMLSTSDPYPIPGFVGAVEISASSSQVCARREDNTVACAGYRTATDPEFVQPVAGVVDAMQIGVGEGFGCALVRGGSVYCWGANDLGQLGVGSTSGGLSRAAPVSGLTDALALEVGEHHACVVSASRGVLCWGYNNAEQASPGYASPLPLPTAVRMLSSAPALEIAAGELTTCARFADSTVRCWGGNFNGMFGLGDRDPVTPPDAIPGLTDAVEIGVSNTAGCALRSTGTVQCWGVNAAGERIDGTPSLSLLPRGVDGVLDGAALSVGPTNGCVLRRGGRVSCWGLTTSGEIVPAGEQAAFQPQDVPGIANASAAAIGPGHGCAAFGSAGGTVSCWGANNVGEIGPGAMTLGINPATPVDGVSGAVQVVAGSQFSCARLSSGEVDCWGAEDAGSLGDGGGSGPRATPAPVAGLADAVDLSAAGEVACAVRATGDVVCWGRSILGVLGQGEAFTYSATPATVPGLPAVARVAVGENSVCAIARDGGLWCWGAPLGNLIATMPALPTRVTGITNALRVAVGTQDAYVTLADGTVLSWGYDWTALGDASTEARETPMPVAGLVDAVDVEAGDGFACALRATGEIACWGSDKFGQLADPTLLLPGNIITSP